MSSQNNHQCVVYKPKNKNKFCFPLQDVSLVENHPWRCIGSACWQAVGMFVEVEVGTLHL